MKWVLVLIALFIAMIMLWSEVGAEPEPVRNITNCPYGDSASPDVCEKLTQQAKEKEMVQTPTAQAVETRTTSEIIVTGGK